MSATSRLDALAAAWPVLAATYPRPWPEEVCRLDLAMLLDAATHPSRPRPLLGRRELAKRWGVADRMARRLLAELGEEGPRPACVPPVSRVRPACVPPAQGQTPGIEQECPACVPPVSRVRPADVHTRTTEPGYPAPGSTAPGKTHVDLAADASGSRDDGHPGPTTEPSHDLPLPLEALGIVLPPAPAPGEGRPSTRTQRQPKGQPKGQPALEPDVGRVWAVYRELHPRAADRPPVAWDVVGAVAQLGAEACIALIRWLHESDEDTPVWARDHGQHAAAWPWRPSARVGLAELAERWQRGESSSAPRGTWRPDVPPAPAPAPAAPTTGAPSGPDPDSPAGRMKAAYERRIAAEAAAAKAKRDKQIEEGRRRSDELRAARLARALAAEAQAAEAQRGEA